MRFLIFILILTSFISSAGTEALEFDKLSLSTNSSSVHTYAAIECCSHEGADRDYPYNLGHCATHCTGIHVLALFNTNLSLSLPVLTPKNQGWYYDGNLPNRNLEAHLRPPILS